MSPVLGSRSTDLRGNFGGHEGRVLRDGDALPLGGGQLIASVVFRIASHDVAGQSQERAADVSSRHAVGAEVVMALLEARIFAATRSRLDQRRVALARSIDLGGPAEREAKVRSPRIISGGIDSG